MKNQTVIREPMFHISKRGSIKPLNKVIIYAVSIFISLFIGGVICSVAASGDPFLFFMSLFEGVFGSERKIWIFLQSTSLLLCVSMALVPAFKMKFWNLGANGQVLIAGLATISCMHYLGGKMSDGLLICLMIVASIAAGIIWAVIPAIFKVFFNTNETLLTLMMNYIASGLITFFIAKWVSGGSGVLEPIPYGNIPDLLNPYLLIILTGVIVTAIVAVYLKYTKHGYENSVVGDSANTAKYVGMNVKKIVIRTMMLSGAVCGIVGLLLVGAIGHTIGVNTVNNMGFTAIMTTWLANCNPVFMILTCVLVTFVSKGMEQVRMNFGMTNDSTANLIIGLMYFFIIACAFFIKYRVIFRKKESKTVSEDK